MTFEEWADANYITNETYRDAKAAWEAGMAAERKRVFDVLDEVDKWNCRVGLDVNTWHLAIEVDDIKKCLTDGLDAFIEPLPPYP